MKKFFSFVAAALVSVAMFAAPATIPSVTDVEAQFSSEGNVVFVVYFDEQVCNDLVLAGTYNGWNTATPDDMIHGEELEGFDGWYVFVMPYELKKDGEVSEEGTCEGKPVQLNEDGTFPSDWAYQTGDAASWVHHGGKEANIEAGYSGESNVKFTADDGGNYGAGVYIYESLYFKLHNSPCVAKVYHDYTVTLYAPDCVGENGETFIPAIAGYAMGWDGVNMTESMDEEGNTIYTYSWNDFEGHAFKFREADGSQNWDNQIKVNVDGTWENNPDIVLGEETNIVIDYSDGAWTKCVAQERTYTITLKAPTANCAAYAPAVVGEFNNWGSDKEETADVVEAPVVMTPVEGAAGVYTATVTATERTAFKFKEAADTNWSNQIQVKKDGAWIDNPNLSFGTNTEIEVDYSEGKWTLCPDETGIEEIVVEKSAVAKKVIVDGQLFIMHEGRLINVLGAQVK